MKKQFCDYCGGKIDFELGSELEIFDNASDRKEFRKDICEGCKKKIIAFLKTLKAT